MLGKIQDFLKRRQKKVTAMEPFTLYLVITLFSAALFLLLMPFLGQHGFDWIVMENNSDYESADYFICILYSLGRERVYYFGPEACYSPLSYTFFYFISKALSADKLLAGVDLLTVPYERLISMTPELLVSPYHLLAFLFYSIAGVFLYVLAVDELNIGKRKKQLLSLSIICSVPMLFGAVERGNLTLYVAVLVLFAMLFKDSLNPVKREIALLLIAVAAGLKFFPAFMGLLYLKEKRYKEAGRLILYGVVFVFVPFLFFGGLDGIQRLLSTLSALSVQNNYIHRIQFFKGALTFLGIHGQMGNLLNVVFLLALIFLMAVTRNKTRMMVYIAAMMAFYPPNAYRYTLLFFLMPLFVWIEEESRENTASSYATAVFFSFMFGIPTIFGLFTGFRLGFGPYSLTYVEFFVYLAAWSFLAFEMVRDVMEFVPVYRRKLRKAKS